MLYTVRIFKALGGRSNEGQWVNNYELQTNLTLESAGMQANVDHIVAFDRALHTNQVNYMRVVTSTFAMDSRPYDPANLRVMELSGVGGHELQPGAGVVDLNITLTIKRLTTLGKAGRLILRGALHWGHVTTGAGGKTVLTDNGTTHMQGLLTTATAALGDLDGELVMINYVGVPEVGGATFVRPIIFHQLGAVSVNRRNHKYFDRKSADGGDEPALPPA